MKEVWTAAVLNLVVGVILITVAAYAAYYLFVELGVG